MKDRFSSWTTFVCALLLIGAGRTAFAQGTPTSSLSTVVLDAGGEAIPGASVAVRNTATGVTVEGESNSRGRFVVASLSPGTYSVSVSLAGFKSFMAPEVRLHSSGPREITATLEVGPATDTQRVTIGSQLVQTLSPAVAS